MNIANDYLEVQEELNTIEEDLKIKIEKILLKIE